MCFVSCWGWLYVEECDIKRGGNGIWGGINRVPSFAYKNKLS